jgi:radical SAM protein with 4Fe4S-binding SPASM domain
VTLTKENQSELGTLVDLARSLGAARFCLYWLVPCGRGSDAYGRLQLGAPDVIRALTLLYTKAREIPAEEMEFLTVDAPQDCIHLLQSMERDGSPDLPDARELVASLNGGCSAGDRVANVDPRGNVYPCQFARSPEFYIGNIRKRPFSEIWNDNSNPVLVRFRMKPSAAGGKCKSCGYLNLCGGGCRVRAYAMSGDISGEDPFCYVTDGKSK